MRDPTVASAIWTERAKALAAKVDARGEHDDQEDPDDA